VLAPLSKPGQAFGGSFIWNLFPEAESSENAVSSAKKKISFPPGYPSPSVDNLLKASVPKRTGEPRVAAKTVWIQQVVKVIF
jgi:hypothetical protein